VNDVTDFINCVTAGTNNSRILSDHLKNKTLMHGDYYFGGMHAGWWALIFVLVIAMATGLNWSRKRK